MSETIGAAEDETDWWEPRKRALEQVLGPMDDMVLHAPIPFAFGFEQGGRADVIQFRKHVDGCALVTADLIGISDQIQSSLGNYELMICERTGQEWGAQFISALSYYTLQAKVEPFETMDLGHLVPTGSPIAGLLFVDYARFVIAGRNCGLLLCLGVTAGELAECRNGRHGEVIETLKQQGVYPFTDLFRGQDHRPQMSLLTRLFKRR